jgi:cation diffusion facilitator CzcD-associated flavoprotein CzcO/acetyl esterase/lipase
MSAASTRGVSFKAIIVGAGFGGIGMAISLKKAGIDNFVLLEKSHDVGGVWRDNSYPGAACDVPSHLYSFSFEPNPNWSHVFSAQPEILAYLRHCADKYALKPHLRFGVQVERADYDEQESLWRVSLSDGSKLSSSLLITATGQLSKPLMPRIEGMDTFRGKAFHSARWDHSYRLEGKRVAVIGTGASAIQFVPAIADRVAQLTVFQRSPAYLLPRPDRAYSKWEHAMFARFPWTTKLYRLAVFVKYETRAIGFTRLRALMKVAVGLPFKMLLAKQVRDPALRARLVPDYPIGCKRILITSDYLPAIAKPNVNLVTDGIRRITPDGVETSDGLVHPADAIIYGTGFAASEFLSPMRVTGREGVNLNDAWRDGAEAYLGITVPGFPNFFMLYGPNTNLGHNSIVYMLESQVAHVMRCIAAMKEQGAAAIEVDPDRHQRFNARVQQRLAHTVWNGCTSWYVDGRGHNSVNWPGFTLSYRWLTNRSGLHAYGFQRQLESGAQLITVPAPRNMVERLNEGMVRLLLRAAFKPFVGPPSNARTERAVVGMLAPLMFGVAGVSRERSQLGGVPAEIVRPRKAEGEGVILFLHGGAFCLGGPNSHRSITTRLAKNAAMPVWVPDYRLAPEHPYPAALDDALACYDALLGSGLRAQQISLGGDSAGGALVLALLLRLKARGAAMPACAMLISPLTDLTSGGPSMQSKRAADPMVRQAWLEQALGWYACPPEEMAHRPLEADLSGLPPMLVQVGEDEILLDDSTRLAQRAAACGVRCLLEIHQSRWHVVHLSAFYLQSARQALRRLAGFARASVAAAGVRDEVRIAQGGLQ